MTRQWEDSSQEELVVSVHHLADLFVLAPVGYCILDRRGRLLEGNFEMARFAGCLRSEILGRSLPSLVQLHDEHAFHEHLDRCFENLERTSVQLHASTWQGHVVVKMVSAPLVQAGGEVASCMTTITDVTALSAAAERLHVLSTAGEALAATLDYEGTLTTAACLPLPALANVAFLDVCDDDGSITRREGATSTRLDGLDDAPQGRVLTTGQPFVCARCPAPTIARAAGEAMRSRLPAREGSLLIVPMHARGRVLGVMTCILTDGRHHSSDDLALAEQLAARAAVAIDNARRHRAARRSPRGRRQLVDVVSRDLRDALRGIRAACERLSATPPWAGATATRQLEAIDCGVLSMDQLTRDLLALSPRESGHPSIAADECDATALVLEAVDLLRPLADEKGISLVASGRHEQRVRCDRDLVVQALLNVIGNAIERTLACGSVWADVTGDAGSIVFVVRDTGDGLLPEELPHAFDGAGHVRRTWRDGLGFGLATAKQIFAAHDGTIKIESAPGVGTTVTLTLPRGCADAPHGETAAPTP